MNFYRRMTLLVMLMALALVVAACGSTAEEVTEDVEDVVEEVASDVEEAVDDAEEAVEEAVDDAEEAVEGDEEGEAEASTTVAAGTDEACAEYAGVEVPADFNIVLVTDIGRINDATFNEYAYNGMMAAAECMGVETNYIETASEADYVSNISNALGSDPEVVITVGFLIADATLEAAEANPDVKFIGVDQFQPEYPENYTGILFREDQGGFLAGAMASLMTETGTVAVVGGLETVPPVVRFVNGFETGAKYVAEDTNVLSVYTDSFTDPAQGASAAEQFLGEGADVIFGAGGQTGSAAVRTAAEAGAWGIGVDQDEYFTTFGGGSAAGADHIATSAVKRVDLGVLIQIGEVLSGNFAGGSFILDAANGGISYADFHDAEVPASVAEQIESIRAGLADGSIDTGVDPITGEMK